MPRAERPIRPLEVVPAWAAAPLPAGPSGRRTAVLGGTVLADTAIRGKDLDEAKALDAKKKAEEAMSNRSAEFDYARAQAELAEFSQQKIDAIVQACAAAATEQAEAFARLAVDETGFGVYEDKVQKNLFASQRVYEFIKPMKTVGVVARHEARRVVDIAEPFGVVAAIVPSTNPTSTAIYKILISLKARCALVISPHPSAVKCITRVAEVLDDAARRAGAPAGAINWMTTVSLEGTQELMKQRDVAVILATGGMGLVRAAYSAGKPAYGVGPGNAPAYIERTADVRKAVRDIITGKTFDNGVLCSSENSVVVDAPIAEQVKREFQAQGCHFLSKTDIDKVAKAYEQRKRTAGLMDFDDLLVHAVHLLEQIPESRERWQRAFDHILVDEYQDTNVAQYLWLRLLAQGTPDVCCVGDDDQSIYGWRGAEVGNILRFEKDFPGATIVRLERNYRSTPHILAAASHLIAHNEGRLGKTLWTDMKEGERISLRGVWDGDEEARTIGEEIEALQRDKHPLSQIAILVRAGFQTREFEERFITMGLPYRVIGGPRFYERAEIRDAMAYCRQVLELESDNEPAQNLLRRLQSQPAPVPTSAVVAAAMRSQRSGGGVVRSTVSARSASCNSSDPRAASTRMCRRSRRLEACAVCAPLSATSTPRSPSIRSASSACRSGSACPRARARRSTRSPASACPPPAATPPRSPAWPTCASNQAISPGVLRGFFDAACNSASASATFCAAWEGDRPR